MSFSLSIDGGQHEWSSESLFAQRSNLLSPSFYGMVRDVLRFGREAPKASGLLLPCARKSAEHQQWQTIGRQDRLIKAA